MRRFAMVVLLVAANEPALADELTQARQAGQPAAGRLQETGQRAAADRVTADSGSPEKPDEGPDEDVVEVLAAWTVRCSWFDFRADAKQEIEDEKKYARELGGVVDLRKMYRAQERVKRADKEIQRADGYLKELGEKAKSCRTEEMRYFVTCVRASSWTWTDREQEVCEQRVMAHVLLEVHRQSPNLANARR